MTIPKITIEQASIMYTDVETMLKLSNELIDKHNAKTEQEQEQYITAEQARVLGAGMAEYRYRGPYNSWNWGNWITCQGSYEPSNSTWEVQYRAIKQPEPHAELKAMYEQQVKDGTVGLVRWDYQHAGTNDQWLECGVPPNWNPYTSYRFVELPTCLVRNEDTCELKIMTIEAAKLFQAELGDTVEWSVPVYGTWHGKSDLTFELDGIYSYMLRGTVKLTIDDEPAKMLTPAQCEAERLARVDTHDVEFKNSDFNWRVKSKPCWDENTLFNSEYRLIRKQPKQVSWKDMPVGVMTNKGEYRAYASDLFWCETKNHNCPILPGYTLSQLELAPASEQPWIAVQDGIDCQELARELTAKGFTYMFCAMRYRITGIAEG